jgi:hypothetical protein
MANQAGDIVPSIGGTPPQSTASKDFGDELDLIAKYNFGPRSNALIGYSHFWRGNKILAPADADFTYVQWELNFNVVNVARDKHSLAELFQSRSGRRVSNRASR